MRTPFSTRRFRAADLDRVMAIERTSFGAEAYDRNLFAEYFHKCGELFLVAEQKGRVCGYIVACNRGETAELVSIAVMPAVRAKGAAQALMDSTIRRLKLRHVAVLRLMVKTGNARALRFYEKYGFQHRRRVPAYYEDGSDGLLMYRAL